MKTKINKLLAACLLLWLPGFAAAATYDLWVLRLGDGPGGTAMNLPNPFSLQHVQIDGASAAVINTYDAPFEGVATLVTGMPNFVSDGQLSMSQDGRFLVFPGYGAEIGQTGGIAGANASEVPRVVARFDTLTHTFDTSTRLTNSFNRSNYRGVTTFDGSGFWVTGNGGGGGDGEFGVRYAELGSSESVRVISINYTTANAEIFDGDLYYSRTTGSGTGDTTNSGVLKAGGLPTTAGEAGDPRPDGQDHRLPSNDWVNGDGYYGFKFSPDGSALFVAALGGSSGNSGIQVFRYDNSAQMWNLVTVLGGANIRQLVVFEGENDSVRIFYTTRETSGDFISALWSVDYNLATDQFGSAVELLAADQGYVFFGVAGTDDPPSLDEDMPLTIISVAPGTDPEPGEYLFDPGTEVTLTAPDEVVLEDGTYYQLLGWIAQGSAPAEGSGNTVTFTLDEPTIFEWRWERLSTADEAIVGWDLRGHPTAAVATLPPTAIAEGITPVFLTRGPGIEMSDLGEGFAATSWARGAESGRQTAIDNGDYFEFGFTVEEGYRAYVSSLDASFRRSAFDSPLHLEWQYSLDGFATPGVPIVPAGKIWEEIGWLQNSSVWRSTTEEFHWGDADFLYLGRNSVGSGTEYRAVVQGYNYMTRDVTLQGAFGEAGNPMPTIDLRGLAELQGVPAGTTVTFRLYAWGNSNTGATNTFALGRRDGPVVGGAVAPEGQLPVTIRSAVVAGNPGPGVHFYPEGAQVTLEAPWISDGGSGARHALLGWEATGSAPAEGDGNSLTFTLNEATTIDWVWEEQHLLAASAEGNGSVEVGIRNILPVPLLGFDFGNFVNAGDQADGVPSKTVADQVEPSVVVRGPGLGPRALGSGGLSTESWGGIPNLPSAIQHNKYFSFKVTPKPGESLELVAIYVPLRYTQGAPHTVALLYSFDNFATFTVGATRRIHDQASGTWTTRHLFVLSDDPDLQNVTSEVEFRLYGIGGTSAAATLALFNDRGYLADDMIVFAGSSESATITGTGGEELWLEVNALVTAGAQPTADSLFTGWSGDFHSNAPFLTGLHMRHPLELTAHFATDSDGDGIPDWWKIHYFGTLSAGADEDPDNDGFTNREEYLRGTNPRVADGALSVDSIHLSRWENPQRDPDLPGTWLIHDYGMGFRGARESSNDNRSALNPFHPDGEPVQAIAGISFDGPRMIVRGEHWDEAWSDGTYETVISVGDDDGNAFYFRYQDELNWYRVVVTGEVNNAPNRPQFGIGVQKRVDGQYHNMFIHDSTLGTDPADTNYYKRVRVTITADGPNFDVEVSGWDQYKAQPGWDGPGDFGYTSFSFFDADIEHGRAGIGTWAQGGGFQDVTPSWNPVNVGTLFESFIVVHADHVVFSEDWSAEPGANDLPDGWENPFATVSDLAGVWRNSAHGTLVQMSTDGRPTSAVEGKVAADADGPVFLAPEVEASTYLLEIGFHPFDMGAIGFVFDYVDPDNYGRVLFANVMPSLEGGMPDGVVVSRKQHGVWSNIFIGDLTFVPTLGQPFVATLSRAGHHYVMSVQEVDRQEPLHRWTWDDLSAPNDPGRHGLATWQTTNAHFLFADAYGVIASGIDPDLAVIAIAKVGETIVLTVDNPSGDAYNVQRTLDLSSGSWETVGENQTGTSWSGEIPAGADRAFWRLVR